MQAKLQDKAEEWGGKRTKIVNKDFTIPEEDYKIYVPKSKQVPLSNSDMKNKNNSSRKAKNAPAIILQMSKSIESKGSHDGIIIK